MGVAEARAPDDSEKLLHIHFSIQDSGGPAGYLFEMRNALRAVPSATRHLEVLEIPPPAMEPLSGSFLARLARKARKTRVIGWRARHEAIHEIYSTTLFNMAWAREYARAVYDRIRGAGVVNVHSVFIAAELAKLDRSWVREHVCLMEHAPTFFVRQVAGDCLEDTDEPRGGEALIRYFTRWQEEVMRKVRAVIWPCPEAMEGYRRSGEAGLDGARHEFCMTGLARPEVPVDIESLRSSWGVEPGQKTILFLGRPHPHKGLQVFDDLAALAASRGRRDLVFLRGGRARRRPAPSNVRDIGFVENSAAALCAADLNVVPNTVTYLDRGVLQALSLGAPLLLSNRGGNKAIANAVRDLPLFEPAANDAGLEAIDRAIELYQSSISLRPSMLAAWRRVFSSESLLENQLALRDRLMASR